MSLKFIKTKESNKDSGATIPDEFITNAQSPQKSALLLENEVGYPDATKLDYIDDNSFLQNLKVRFLNKQIYTCIESTVIAINPYEQLPIYSTEVIAAYEHHNIFQLPPHIYALCEYVLYCLKERNTDQCIITSGVSGSGKSESIKYALNYFVNGSSNRNELNQSKIRLNSIPVILEAFGNACIESNNNSTRLFYTLEIDFDFRGDPLGGQITDYFLEKTRVAKHEIYGYNFHIFYQLIGGSGTTLLKFLKLRRNIESYHLLKDRPTDMYASNGQHYSEEFQKTKLTLHSLGFSSNEIVECLQMLACILKLGNVQFLRKANIDSTEGCNIFNDYEIKEICEVFNLNYIFFTKLLTQKVVKNQNEIFITEISADSATKIKNSLCKAFYFRLVTWIIEKINELIKTKPSLNLTRNNLALFDSFGFESYSINFLEQLLINYLQEKTEQIFVDINFRQRQEEFIREDIGWEKINFASNDLICSLIERPMTGILSILHEESSKSIYFREEIFLKELNQLCSSDLSFVKINNPVHLDSNGNGYFLHSLPYRRRRLSASDVSRSVPQLCFGVRHYNETIVYSINGFIEKNTDHISRNWSQFLFQSEHQLLKRLFAEGNPARIKSLKKPITLASQFSIAVESMISKLQGKEIHYIKCVKPNKIRQPNIFDDEYVYKQLASQFLIEHSEFAQNGYFHSEKYGTFFRRYRMLTPQTWPHWKGSLVNGVFICLNHVFDADLNEFNFGKRKIFIKHMKTLIQLEEHRSIKLNDLATKIQRNLKKWMEQRKYYRMIVSQIKIARFYRNFKRKKYLLWLSKHLPSRSPIARDWPPSPHTMRFISQMLRKIHHKWRCHRYRMRFDQNNRNRMREKVTAMMLFKNKKASYKNSVSHPFRGDYIRIRQNSKWKRLYPTLGDVYVVFADLVSKVTKRCGKFVQKVIVISTSSFIVLDGKTMQINHNIQLKNIYKISVSPYKDNILIIHIFADRQEGRLHSTRAFIFESSHLIELITKLFLVIQNAIGHGPNIEIAQEFQVYTGKDTLVLVFKNQQQSSTTAAALQSSSTAHVKINRKSNRLEFSI